jgi:hypothetical protein
MCSHADIAERHKSMKRILLVEPDYRSKFPPLGLMRIGTYHKAKGDSVVFVRGYDAHQRSLRWDRVYVASLFTWELLRTIKTIRYYSQSVSSPKDIIVGGIGVTLMPDYVRKSAECTVVTGLLDTRDKLEKGSPILECEVPDYSVLDSTENSYVPTDTFFLKATKGCVHKCKFCAVPKLEPEYKGYENLPSQVRQAVLKHGDRQHLVLLDNNVLAHPHFERIIDQIRDLGFAHGMTRNKRRRDVDFNQGIDARIIAHNPRIAKLLSSINLSPVRLAFDTMRVEKDYRKAVQFMAHAGFRVFTNYMLYNFTDTPEDFYTRLQVNMELAQTYNIIITGFPMRYVPIDSVSRQHVSPKWKWRYLRGIRCILLATRGLVGTNPNFVQSAFGRTYEEFIEIVSMPDQYIIFRTENKDRGAHAWHKLYQQLGAKARLELMDILSELNGRFKERSSIMAKNPRYRAILEHYYPPIR